MRRYYVCFSSSVENFPDKVKFYIGHRNLEVSLLLYFDLYMFYACQYRIYRSAKCFFYTLRFYWKNIGYTFILVKLGIFKLSNFYSLFPICLQGAISKSIIIDIPINEILLYECVSLDINLILNKQVRRIMWI